MLARDALTIRRGGQRRRFALASVPEVDRRAAIPLVAAATFLAGFGVAELTGVPEERLERLAGGDLSEILLVPRADGSTSVAKGGVAVATEAAMLRSLMGAGIPVPGVESEFQGVVLLFAVSLGSFALFRVRNKLEWFQ